ncbi:hypothetical protein HOLleu_15266 [Holothuria leucospilota]|uniref:Phosphatidic acid phosphatase type 2/haloperoxidase domain-containing protein n=1 Tax=Holothuria leucospilota TaxID=206669 RepID=A0A9Q1C7Q8_HOLLE|nr:hypothetical protein HOLleu_15266 [Holothuria leucospilota]
MFISIELNVKILPALRQLLNSRADKLFRKAYVTSHVVVPNARLPPVLLGISSVGGAFIWGASRVMSHRHFWSDVWTGFAMGTLIALYLIGYPHRNPIYTPEEDEDETDQIEMMQHRL